MKNWYQAIKEYRKAEGITQNTMGEALGLPQGTISAWERLKQLPSEEHQNGLLKLYPGLEEYLEDIADPRFNTDDPTMSVYFQKCSSFIEVKFEVTGSAEQVLKKVQELEQYVTRALAE